VAGSAISSSLCRAGIAAGLAPRSWSPALTRIPAALTAATVLSQICYPLTSGTTRDRLTIATVLLWAAASLSHATVTRGLRFAGGLLLTSGGIGFGAELLGTATGFRFGPYHYDSGLGVQWAGVPLVIALAWVMMAYPALLVGRRIGRPVLGGTLALASWDLFLDPQMVDARHWHFTGGGLRINGIPIVNTLGWVLVSLLIMISLQTFRASTPAPDAADRLPYALYLWTYASSVLAAAAFFGRPAVALAGGLVMGIPAGALARALRRGAVRA
jgi:putative membrane protein